MNKKKDLIISDISFLSMLLLLFICMMYMAENTESLQRNSIILAVALTVVIITYFTSIAAGLIMNIVLIFIYSTYVIFTSAYQGVSVDINIYFWIFWSPCLTAVTYMFSNRTLVAEKENTVMNEQLQRLSGVDILTELKNMRGFEQECTVYMKIAKRYKLELVLLIWQVRYQNELSQMVGANGMETLVRRISKYIGETLREEDAVFILGDSPYLWGTLLFTNTSATEIITERVGKKLEEIEVKTASGRHKVAVDMRIGAAMYSEEIQSPFHFLEQAVKKAEYDV